MINANLPIYPATWFNLTYHNWNCPLCIITIYNPQIQYYVNSIYYVQFCKLFLINPWHRIEYFDLNTYLFKTQFPTTKQRNICQITLNKLENIFAKYYKLWCLLVDLISYWLYCCTRQVYL